jgi:hypothetical protein
MDSLRPKRATKKSKRYLQSPERTLQPAQLTRKKASRQKLSRAVKPIAVRRVLNKPVLYSPLPTYVPPIKLPLITGQGVPSGATELQTFQKFLIKRVVNAIVAVTNSYTERKQAAKEYTIRARLWKNITFIKIIRYIGCLIYIKCI